MGMNDNCINPVEMDNRGYYTYEFLNTSYGKKIIENFVNKIHQEPQIIINEITDFNENYLKPFDNNIFFPFDSESSSQQADMAYMAAQQPPYYDNVIGQITDWQQAQPQQYYSNSWAVPTRPRPPPSSERCEHLKQQYYYNNHWVWYAQMDELKKQADVTGATWAGLGAADKLQEMLNCEQWFGGGRKFTKKKYSKKKLKDLLPKKSKKSKKPKKQRKLTNKKRKSKNTKKNKNKHKSKFKKNTSKRKK